MSGTITKVSGPLVVAEGLADANVSDVVRVGSQRLIGEILNMTGDTASIQVYEETSGLGSKIVMDSELGIVTANGNNIFAQTTLIDFPYLNPGVNTITCSVSGLEIAVIYTPVYA